VFVYIFLSFGLSMLLCVPPGPTQYIFHTPMAQYSLYVLKVPLNSNKQTNKQCAHFELIFNTCSQQSCIFGTMLNAVAPKYMSAVVNTCWYVRVADWCAYSTLLN